MTEHEKMEFVNNESEENHTPEAKECLLENKWKVLLQYLIQKESTEILLLDLLRSKELSQEEYSNLVRKWQDNYRAFLKKLTENEQEISLQ